MDYLKGRSTRSLGGAGLLRQEALGRTGGGLGGSAVAMLLTVPFDGKERKKKKEMLKRKRKQTENAMTSV